MGVVFPTTTGRSAMKRGRLPQQLVLGPQEVAKVLTRLASTDAPGSQELYARLMGSWGNRPDRAYITFRPTTSERLVLRQIPLPAKVVQSSYRYVAVYRSTGKTKVEVILRTPDRPPSKKTLKVRGGTRRFTLIKLYQTKESTMAKGKTKGTTKSKAADPVDELEAELEGLEEVEIDDEEEDAPDIEEEDEDEEEDEEDDEDVDYSSMTNADLKKLCKERGIKGIDKANKAKLVKLLTEADAEGDEEDDEEEDDGLDEMDRAALKARMAELDLGKAKKLQSDDDLRALIREATDDEDDEEEEEEEEEDDGPDFDSMSRAELKAHIKAEGLPVKVLKSMSDDDLRAAITGASDEEEEDEAPAPKKGGTKKATGKGGKQPTQLVRQLPKGKLGANDIAEMAGTKPLNVRNFLRNNKTKFPKDEELGRYAFTRKQAEAIVKAMKKGGTSTAKK